MDDNGDYEVFEKKDFSKGAILKIIFHDFLTYRHAEVVPGPHMNVIVGPNGTGKSTIICGICLASGGSPKLLGRSDNKGDFIRHGCTDGWVEMYLKDDDATDGVKAFKVLLRAPNNAIYFIDGKKVTLIELTTQIGAYNIQVDNPCTFLAQDKVKSFAEQDSRGLLVNTMKAGPTNLMEMHSELVEKAGTKGQNDAEMKEIEKNYQRLVADLNKTRESAQKYEERKQANKRLQAFKGKLASIKLEEALKEYDVKSAAVENAKIAYRDVERKKAPIEMKMKEINNQKKKQDSVVEKIRNDVDFMKKNLAETIENFKEFFNDDAVVRAKKEFERTKAAHESWDKDLKNFEGLLKQAEEKLAAAKNVTLETGPLNEKKKDLAKLDAEYSETDKKITFEQRKAMDRKRQLEDSAESFSKSFTDKFRRLGVRDDSLSAWNWYTDNRHRFKYPVYVPVLFMQVPKQYHVQLNNTISFRDATVFIFGCAEDEAIILNEKRYRVNSTVMESDMVEKFTRNYHCSDELKAVGFKDYVINVFKTVPPVRAYLISVNHLNEVLIGGEEVDRNCEAIADKFKNHVSLFLTNKNRIEVCGSRYDSNRIAIHRSTFQNHNNIFNNLHELSYENNNADEMAKIDKILKEIDDRRTKLRNDRGPIEKLKSEIVAIQNELQKKRDNILSAENFSRRTREQLKNHQETKPNLEATKKALEEIERTTKVKAPNEMEKISKQVATLSTACQNLTFEQIEKLRYLALHDVLRRKLEEIQQDAIDLETKLNDSKQEERSAKEKVKELKNEMKEIAKCSSSRLEQLKNPDEIRAWHNLQEQFITYEISENFEEIEEEIRQGEAMQEARAKDGTRQDVERLKELIVKEEEERKKKEKYENVAANWENDMQELVNKWIQPLEELINKISRNFASYFEKIKCAGEVRLHKPEDSLDINEYGVDIYVQFQGYNKMHRLTAQQQSGGERSVSTMLYLMALQELCPVPFRCVDEINQGMDPTNERMVFNMMVDLLSGNEGQLSHSQYFILTPKLLPGLNFNSKVTVLIVQNTAMMTDNPSALSIERIEIVV